MKARIACLLLATFFGLLPDATAEEPFDLVLEGGRVIDPETSLDAVRNVGIRGGTIVAVSAEPLVAKRTIDAGGLIVAPGFIDLHQHAQSAESYRLMALDGVTTALELEIGVPDIVKFIELRHSRTPIHYGASASYLASRVLAWGAELAPSGMGPEAGILPKSGPATNEAASPERLARVLATLKR
jgi:N-acyl-D-glutamate deacylase